MLDLRTIGLCSTLFLASIFIGCSSSDKNPKVIEKSNVDIKPSKKTPVVQVHQTFNLSYSQLWTATMNALTRRNIGVRAFDQAGGVIVSDWVNVTDAMCGIDSPSRAQLDCRVQLRFQLETITDDASGIHAAYNELCAFTEEIRLECPDSQAERLMLSIVAELRAFDENR